MAGGVSLLSGTVGAREKVVTLTNLARQVSMVLSSIPGPPRLAREMMSPCFVSTEHLSMKTFHVIVIVISYLSASSEIVLR